MKFVTQLMSGSYLANFFMFNISTFNIWLYVNYADDVKNDTSYSLNPASVNIPYNIFVCLV